MPWSGGILVRPFVVVSWEALIPGEARTDWPFVFLMGFISVRFGPTLVSLHSACGPTSRLLFSFCHLDSDIPQRAKDLVLC